MTSKKYKYPLATQEAINLAKLKKRRKHVRLSQGDGILLHLQSKPGDGWASSRELVDLVGWKFGTRISELRARGIAIESRKRAGDGSLWEYRLARAS